MLGNEIRKEWFDALRDVTRCVKDTNAEQHRFVEEVRSKYNADVNTRQIQYQHLLTQCQQSNDLMRRQMVDFIEQQSNWFQQYIKEQDQRFKVYVEQVQVSAEQRLESIQQKVEEVQRQGMIKDVVGDAFSVTNALLIVLIGFLVFGLASNGTQWSIMENAVSIASILIAIQRPIGRLFYLQLQRGYKKVVDSLGTKCVKRSKSVSPVSSFSSIDPMVKNAQPLVEMPIVELQDQKVEIIIEPPGQVATTDAPHKEEQQKSLESLEPVGQKTSKNRLLRLPTIKKKQQSTTSANPTSRMRRQSQPN